MTESPRRHSLGGIGGNALPISNRHAGATLLETLVVIGIIAVLIAILLSVVMRVRFAANRAVCASNLRQIGALLHAYANDNRGEIPAIYAGYDGTSGEPPRPTAYFNSLVVATGGVGLLLSPPIGSAQPGYVRSARIFICPGELAAEQDEYRTDGGDGFVWDSRWPDRLPTELGGMSYCYNYVPEGGDWYQYRYGMWGIKEEPHWHRGDFGGLERHNLGRAASKAVMVERTLYIYDQLQAGPPA